MLAYLLASLGIILGQIYPLLSLKYSIFALSISCAGLLLNLNIRSQKIKYVALLILITFLSFSYSNYRTQAQLSAQISQPINNIILTGYITSPSKSINGISQTTFYVNSGNFKQKNLLLSYPESYNLTSGYNYTVQLSIKPIVSAINQDAYDSNQMLLAKDLIGSGFITSPPTKLKPNYSIFALIAKLRINIINNLNSKLVTVKYKGFFIALVTGYQGLIPNEQWETFRRTGINHIISISGLHLTIATSTFIIIVSLLIKLLPPSKIPQQIILAWISVIFATIYALLAGFSIPTQRALYMVIIGAYLLSCRYYIPLLYKLVIILFIVLIIDPFSVYSIGFWFSFLLVASIFITLSTEKSRQSKFYSWIRLQLIITATGIPLSIFYFSSTSISSILANVWAVPVLGSLFTPAVFISTMINNTQIIKFTGNCLDLALYPIEILAHIPLYMQAKPNLANTILSYIGLIILILPLPIKGKNILGLFLFINFTFASRDKYVSIGSVNTHVFSSQKIGVVIATTKAHNMLIINNNESQIDQKAFQNTVMPYINAQNIRSFDYLLSNNTNESEFIEYLAHNHITILSDKSAFPRELDGLDLAMYTEGKKFAVVIKTNFNLSYIGNCYNQTNNAKIDNLIITLPLTNCSWLLSGSYNNLIINNNYKQNAQIEKIINNLNLSAQHVYQLLQNKDVEITIK